MAKAKQRTYQDVKEMIEKENYVLLSKEEDIVNEKGFVLAKTYLLVWCKNSKHEPRNITLNDFHQGKRCKLCRNEELREKRAFTYEEVKKYFNSFGYKLSSTEYENAHQVLETKCPNNHEYRTTWNNFQQGSRCPHCYRISNGEQSIMNCLDKLNVRYIHDESYFKDLSNVKGKLLRPDFILPDYKIWIEYDGEQHYKIIDYFGGLMTLLNAKYRDNIKNEYTKKNGWKLIRIPYWEFENIEKILELELK